MPSLRGTQTERNLLLAFAGESQARNRYTFFASQAKKEGYEQIAAVFSDTADNEREHAKRFFRFLEGGEVEITGSFPAGVIGSTAENLAASADGERHEHSELYPEFARVAETEGFPGIAAVFRAVAVSEQGHEQRFRALLANLQGERVFSREGRAVWRCRNCGYLHEGPTAPEVCPACAHPQAYFELKAENY
ncbi:MAG: rubrerythrin family protein [Clostridia bacterium]|nr:rubrerythrin family protein [Clostridia bacterium]MDH7572816.1 rubrerythrin family protein [Clostridia bacterium]